MKFTNNRKKAVNLNPKTEGKYSWENGDVAFGKKERGVNYKKDNERPHKSL